MLKATRRLGWGAALVLGVALLVGSGSPEAEAQARYNLFLQSGTAREARLPAGQSVTVQTSREIGDIVVGNPDIADVSPLTETSIYLLGKQIGRTTVTIYDLEKKPIGVLQVEVGVDVTDLTSALRQHLPGNNITVSTVNGRLRLGGTVKNGQALSVALELARQYAGDNVINAIEVTDTQQVMLEVRFLEASRNAGRDLGVSIRAIGSGSFRLRTGTEVRGPVSTTTTASDNAAGSTVETTTSRPPLNSFFPLGDVPFSTVIGRLLDSGLKVDVLVDALETKGLARTLAEPNLVAMSGETAGFLAGGEIPLPVTNADGETTVTFKEFGIRLAFTPVVLDDGLINLQLVSENSQIDPSIVVQGIPGFLTRRTETTVELRDGQSFSIAGLLSADTAKAARSVPYIAQLPIIGALFRSQSFQKRETDLVVIVTPRIVRPAAPDEELRTPLDKTRSSNDAEFFLLGMMEVTDEQIRKFALGEGITGPYGHILELQPEAQDVVVKK